MANYQPGAVRCKDAPLLLCPPLSLILSSPGDGLSFTQVSLFFLTLAVVSCLEQWREGCCCKASSLSFISPHEGNITGISFQEGCANTTTTPAHYRAVKRCLKPLFPSLTLLLYPQNEIVSLACKQCRETKITQWYSFNQRA